MEWKTNIGKDMPFSMIVQSVYERRRAYFFWQKEPETFEWINDFPSNGTFFDIGANVGTFAMYAKVKFPEISVYAFEPEKNNFERLLQNIEVNKLNIESYNYAVSDVDGMAKFYLPELTSGGSGGQIDQPFIEGQEFRILDSYDVEVHTIDFLAEKFGVPNYIKIDVDGNEQKILQGAEKTFKNENVKGILVEICDKHMEIEEYMTSFGFSGWNRYNSPDLNRRALQKEHNRIYTRV